LESERRGSGRRCHRQPSTGCVHHCREQGGEGRRIGAPQNSRNGVILFAGLTRWLLYAKNSQDQRSCWLLSQCKSGRETRISAAMASTPAVFAVWNSDNSGRCAMLHNSGNCGGMRPNRRCCTTLIETCASGRNDPIGDVAYLSDFVRTTDGSWDGLSESETHHLRSLRGVSRTLNLSYSSSLVNHVTVSEH
jgi:hypothetical protein